MDFNPEDFSEGFSKMSNLRSLRIDRVDSLKAQRHLTLPNNLRYLRWIGCPFKCLASNDERQMKFVHLDLQHSQIEYLCKEAMVILFFFFFKLRFYYFLLFLFFFFFFNCSYKYKYTPDVFELPPFIYKAVLLN